MSVKPESEVTPPTTTTSAAPPASAPPALEPPVSAAPPVVPEAPAASVKPSPVTLGDDDDNIPEGADLLQLSRSALSKRLDRATKKNLRERFGTDNVDEIKSRLDKAAAFEKLQEEQRRANLSEVERWKEDADKWRKRYEDIDTRWKQERRATVVTNEHQRVTSIAKEFLDPDYLDTEMPRFAQELMKRFSREEIANLGDDVIRGYFKSRIEAKPKLGKDFGTSQAAPPAPPPPPPPTTQPFTNGLQDNERPTARIEGSGLPVNGEKTYRPGLPNSMSSQEAKQAASNEGYRW